MEREVDRLDPVTTDVLVQVTTELATMTSLLGRTPVRRRVEDVQERTRELLHRIARLIAAQEINPWVRLRLSAGESPVFPSAAAARIGVFPIAANPIHWGHLLDGLSVMAQARLDKILYVLAPGSCPTADLFPEEMRRSAAAEAIALFQPLFALVPAQPGAPASGPTSLFRLLGLNSQQAVEAFYICAEETGDPRPAAALTDTLVRETRADGTPPSGRLHHFSVVIIGCAADQKNGSGLLRTMRIPAPLPDASSAGVRAALRSAQNRSDLAFLPACAFRHLRMLSAFD